MSSKNLKMLINGQWVTGSNGRVIDVTNPATGGVLAQLSLAEPSDVEAALQSSQKGFELWKEMTPLARQNILERAARLIEERHEQIASDLTAEAGKPIGEARMEVSAAVDVLRWYGEEGKRAYGRTVASRVKGTRQSIIKEPVGPVIAFIAWNFPAINFMRKVAGALGAGCSIILKASEDTPFTGIALAQAFVDAGLPDGVLNLVYGDPPQISAQMCQSDIPRKLTFTGSVEVGKHLSALAAQNLLRCTMELGGHAPFIVFDDADIDLAASMMVAGKFRNAGQVCISPTRFYVQNGVYDQFIEKVQLKLQAIKVGDGAAPGTTMGPLINARRVGAMQNLLDDCLAKGGEVLWQAEIPQTEGSFFAPTVLGNVSDDALIMSEEPFGPIAPVLKFDTLESVLEQANSHRVGLAAYAFTKSGHIASVLSDRMNAGMLAINSLQLGAPETPFGGVEWSGNGSEGGTEGLETFLRTRLVTETFK